jgi:hypothetical protein
MTVARRTIAQLECTLVSVGRRASPSMSFDLLWRDGQDMRQRPLLERKAETCFPSPPRPGAIALFPSISPAQRAHFSNARGSSASRV